MLTEKKNNENDPLLERGCVAITRVL